MERFDYKPIDLQGPSFRLVRLVKGNDVDIHCELFEAWLHPSECVLPYEALSYTWGGTERAESILVHGKELRVTQNLYLALRHLRFEHVDRILWIDAICINQDDVGERGHQVQQMANIYNKANRVVIWLGVFTSDTDVIMNSMIKLQKESNKYACNHWKFSDERWANIWSGVQPILRSVHTNLEARQRNGLNTLLRRSWFERVWILQEVANAQAAVIVCGTKSASSRMFALIPSLLGIKPSPHCQAVLDILPGPLRRDSWWHEKRDLHTLLDKFRDSRASEPLDKIYALLGMSSDTCDSGILRVDYSKSETKVIQDTTSFLLSLPEVHTGYNLPRWTMSTFSENLNSLSNAVADWAVEEDDEAMVQLLVTCGHAQPNREDENGSTLLLKAATVGTETIVRFFLERYESDAEWKDRGGRTPLSWAAMNGHEKVVQLLVERGDVDVNSKDKTGRTPLSWAAENGRDAVVRLLVERDDVDVNLKDKNGWTPLTWAAENRNKEVVQLLIARDLSIGLEEKRALLRWRMLPFWAAKEGVKAIVEALLEPDNIQGDWKDKDRLMTPVWADMRDDDSRTLLSLAAGNGQEAVVQLLVERDDVNVNSEDKTGRTPLSWAAENGHDAVVRLLVERDDVEADLNDREKRTPLLWAARRGRDGVVKILLERGNVDVGVEDYNGWTPLFLAEWGRYGTVVKLLTAQ